MMKKKLQLQKLVFVKKRNELISRKVMHEITFSQYVRFLAL